MKENCFSCKYRLKDDGVSRCKKLHKEEIKSPYTECGIWEEKK